VVIPRAARPACAAVRSAAVHVVEAVVVVRMAVAIGSSGGFIAYS